MTAAGTQTNSAAFLELNRQLQINRCMRKQKRENPRQINRKTQWGQIVITGESKENSPPPKKAIKNETFSHIQPSIIALGDSGRYDHHKIEQKAMRKQ